MSEDRKKVILPIVIEGINKSYWDQDYLVDKTENIDKVKEFYEKLNIEILGVKHITPSIGPERDEFEAYYPEGWSEESDSYWTDVLNEKKQVIFSMFIKKAPWDYCFFARPRKDLENLKGGN